MKRKITPSETPIKDLHQYLLGSVAPRPIAFVSTMSDDGVANLAPYSFFNAFSSNPPIVVFSSNRRVRDNTTKDTLANVIAQKEAVINVVSYDIVRQMALTSVEFEASESEFDHSGLTRTDSELVAPPAVAESPVNMECRVKEVITLGEHGGAGHLIVCEVLLMHIREDVIVDGRIDPHRIDLMGRMGRSYYVRASGEAIHSIYQDITPGVIGYTALPDQAKHSHHLSANGVARLAALRQHPSEAILAEAHQIISESDEQPDLLAQRAIAEDHLDLALALLTVS